MTKPGLLTSSRSFKPIRYPWALDACRQQHRIHWLPEEIPLGEDVKDWATRLSEPEKNLLTQIFRLFTQSDVEVNDNYMERYSAVFKPAEVKMMLSSFSSMECFDDQTELLTSSGWVNVKDISMSHRVAQYDIESRVVSFVNPTKVVSYPHKGVMHHYKNSSTDICVTPNHKMIAELRGKTQKVESQEKILGSNYNYPACGVSLVGSSTLSDLNRLLIAVQADGSLKGLCPTAENKKWNTVLVGLTKERKKERLVELLEKCGISYSIRNRRGGNHQIFTFSLPESVDLTTVKTFGFFNLEEISTSEAQDILNEIVFWDGTINKSTGQRLYYSSVKEAVDFVQAVSVLSSNTISNIGTNRKNGSKVLLPQGTDYELTKDHKVVSFVDGRSHKTYPHRKEIDYDGFVYCVSVPTENLVSRRNGKVAFTGNTIHVIAYSLLLETLGMEDSEFEAFSEYKEMQDKIDYMQTFGVDTDEDVLRTLAMFGGFTEGLQLFASFAMLMNFPRFNKMKGMGQIVTWSIRDESLHVEGIIKLFHTFAAETGALTLKVRDDILDCCRKVVAMEDKFIDLAFQMGPVQGMTAEDIKLYIRFIADWRLDQLGLPPLYNIKENPLPWLAPMLNGVEHANFFEARATEYSKGATQGTWDDVWKNFETRTGT